MAQVPYSPVPTAQPTAPGERVSESTPGAAFGENIGAAIEKLGSTVGQVGNELFTRAIALQDLANENAAREAQTKFALGASQLHADYSAKTGKDAADSLQGFLDSQAQLRQQIGSGLGSPMARKYYDADSLPFMQRNVFSAAAHAAEENKKYTIGTMNASADIVLKQIGDDPSSFEDNRALYTGRKLDASMVASGDHDPNSAINKDIVNNSWSAATKEFLLGIGKTKPQEAMEMIGKYRHDLTEPDYIQVQGQLEGKATTIAADNIARQYIVEHTNPTTGQMDVSNAQAEKDLAGIVDKTDGATPLLKSAVISHYAGLQFQNRIAQQRDEQEGKKWIDDAIVQYNVTSDRQLEAVPGAIGQIQKAGPQIAGRLQDYINQKYEALHRPTSTLSLNQLRGLRNNNNGDFLNVNPYDPKYQLNDKDAATVRGWQNADSKKAYDDPRVQQSMLRLRGAIGPMLQAAGIYTRDKSNPDDYDHFVGALQEGLQEYAERSGGKRPTYEETVEMGKQILNTQVNVPGGLLHFWGPVQEPAFKHWDNPTIENIPQDFIKGFTQQNPNATEDMIVRNYNRHLFDQLYGGKGGGAKPAQ